MQEIISTNTIEYRCDYTPNGAPTFKTIYINNRNQYTIVPTKDSIVYIGDNYYNVTCLYFFVEHNSILVLLTECK